MRLVGAGPLRRRETAVGYLMVSPATIPILAFVIVPTALVGVMSLLDWNLIADHPRFVGLGNYRDLAHDAIWWQALGQTLYFALLTVPTITVLGFLLAWSLFRRARTSLVEGVIFAPYVMPPVATILTWAWIFNPSYGGLNALLARLHLTTVDWLGDPRAIVPAMAIYTIWHGTGLSMVMYLAALARVPYDMVEAAALDGAGSLATLRHILAPLVSPTTYVVVVITAVGAVKVFAVSYLFTAGTGGPGLRGLTVVLYQYQQAFVNFSAGYGAAVSIGLSLVLLLLLGVGMTLGRNRVFYR